MTIGRTFTEPDRLSRVTIKEDPSACFARINDLYRHVVQSDFPLNRTNSKFQHSIPGSLHRSQTATLRPLYTKTSLQPSHIKTRSSKFPKRKSALAHITRPNSSSVPVSTPLALPSIPKPLSPHFPISPHSRRSPTQSARASEESPAVKNCHKRDVIELNDVSITAAVLSSSPLNEDTPSNHDPEPSNSIPTMAMNPDQPVSHCTRSAARSLHSRDLEAPNKPKCCLCPSSTVHASPPKLLSNIAGLVSDEQRNAKAETNQGVLGFETTNNGNLLGPFKDAKRLGEGNLFVHYECACWALRVSTPKITQPDRIVKAYRRSRRLRCARCYTYGATVKCHIEHCRRRFHYRCLQSAGGRQVFESFDAFCATHAKHSKDHVTMNIKRELRSKKNNNVTVPISAGTQTKPLNESKSVSVTKGRPPKKDATLTSSINVDTQALDDPHCQFTNLRSMETEIVFSKKWRVTSVPTAPGCGVIILSLKRRDALHRTDRFVSGNGFRAFPMSALEVASGRMGYMSTISIRHNHRLRSPRPETGVVVEQCAKANIFLLRNFRRAPKWPRGSLHIMKSSSYWGKKIDNVAEPRTVDVENMEDISSKVQIMSVVRKRGRPRKRVELCLSDNICVKPGPDNELSMPLPSFKKPKRVVIPGINMPDGPFGTDVEDRDELLSRMGLTGRSLSTWENFLVDQLPKERILRPNDCIDESMRNMARLWSSMTTEEKEKYGSNCDNESKSNVKMFEAEIGCNRPSENRCEQMNLARRCSVSPPEAKRNRPCAREIGLFSNCGIRSGSGLQDNVGKVVSTEPKKSSSMSLRRAGKWMNGKNVSGKMSMSLDEMFPISEEDLIPTVKIVKPPAPSDGTSVNRVRPPPLRRGKCHGN